MFIQYYCKKIISILFFVITSMMSYSVYGATFNILAEYNPDSYDPLGGRFINKTPCNMGYPQLYYCDPKKPLESATIIQFPVDIFRKVTSKGGKSQYLSYYKTTGPKTIVLRNDKDGGSYELKLVPTHIGMETSKMNLYGNHPRPMSRIDGDCSFLTELSWGTPAFSELLLHSINPSAQGRVAECYYNSPVDDNGYYWISRVIYGFRLESPNPLKMSNGIYTGSLKLSVGRNQDIDFGDATYYNGVLAHDINFIMTVHHQLRVEFPKGEGEGRSKVTLLPPRGWNDWIYKGREIPDMLQQELPFRLWSNSPFTVTLRCQYISGTECALKNAKGHQAILNTYFINGGNQEIKMTTIPFLFSSPSGSTVINGARKIKFKVAGDVVKEMMKYPGSTYKGDVTLIFDAAIN